MDEVEEIAEDTLGDGVDKAEENQSNEVQKTMDDTIRETLEKINARSEEEPKDDRVRDEKGRFSKNGDAQPEEIAPNKAVEEQQVATATVPPELQRLGLRKEEAEAIASNPVALQAFIRRSEEMHRGLEQYRQHAQFAQEMGQAFAPFQQTMQQLGVTPSQAISKLMGADHALRFGSQQQKQGMLMTIARDYGIDMNFDPSQVQLADPAVSNMQMQLQQMQNWIQSQAKAVEEREASTLNSEISRFASDPANTYFEQVRNDMAGLLQSGIASDLKDAYERAIYANPTVRAQVLAKQQADAEAKRKAESAAKAMEAKKAAAANVVRKPALGAKKPIGSMEDTIRAEAERLGLI